MFDVTSCALICYTYPTYTGYNGDPIESQDMSDAPIMCKGLVLTKHHTMVKCQQSNC